jgi:cytochrome b subunit of formate dehydrogenase
VFNHHHPDSVTRPIPFYTDRMFSVLTTLSLLGLFLHVVLDLGAELRVLFTRKEHHFHAHSRPNGEKVVRFDIHQLIQHWSLMSSVILLTLSGWPIRAAEIGPSAAMISVFGGLENARFIHRVMGAVLCLAAAYHLIYLTVKILQRKLALSMLPMPRDAVDMLNNMLYFVGVKKERPKFAVFSYAEKFDYWAVFWGVAIMGGTGFIRWFPVWFGKWLPGDLIAAAQIAHGEEATLAALALFVWHLYNVHLRPSIFPMSWIWIDGKISIEALAEEHAEEYEKLVAEKKLPGAPAAGGTPPAGGKP